MTEGPILVKTNEYDENQKYFNEPHAPVRAREIFNDYRNITKGAFLNEQKMSSLCLQCQTMAGLPDVKEILEIGPGNNVTSVLMKQIDYQYYTMDAQPLVKPDFLYDFVEFDPKSIDQTFDLVAAFQMLEHVPYDQTLVLINKMKKMSRKYLFISVPYYCWSFRLEFVLPDFAWMKALLPDRIHRFITKPRFFAINSPYKNAPNRKYREQYVQEFPLAVHYWEIGRGSITKQKFLNDLTSQGLIIKKSFHAKHYPYHYFVLCEKVV